MLLWCSFIYQKLCECLKKFKALTFFKKHKHFPFFFQLESAVNEFPGCQQLWDDWTKHKVHLFELVSKCVNGWHVTRQPGNDPAGSFKDWASPFFAFFIPLSEPGNHFPCHWFSNASWVGAVAIETADRRGWGLGGGIRSRTPASHAIKTAMRQGQSVKLFLRRLMGKKVESKVLGERLIFEYFPKGHRILPMMPARAHWPTLSWSSKSFWELISRVSMRLHSNQKKSPLPSIDVGSTSVLYLEPRDNQSTTAA